jgi:hypothetical protein
MQSEFLVYNTNQKHDLQSRMTFKMVLENAFMIPCLPHYVRKKNGSVCWEL